MMLRIAKRKRKQILKAGSKIIEEGHVRECGWKRKDCGFCVKIKHPSGLIATCCGKNPLSAYKMALEWALSDGNPQYIEYEVDVSKITI